MVGKEYVYFKSITEMKNLAQFGRWCVNASPFATRLEIKTFLSGFWVDGKQKDVTAENISLALKFAAGALECPSKKVTPIE